MQMIQEPNQSWKLGNPRLNLRIKQSQASKEQRSLTVTVRTTRQLEPMEKQKAGRSWQVQKSLYAQQDQLRKKGQGTACDRRVHPGRCGRQKEKEFRGREKAGTGSVSSRSMNHSSPTPGGLQAMGASSRKDQKALAQGMALSLAQDLGPWWAWDLAPLQAQTQVLWRTCILTCRGLI